MKTDRLIAKLVPDRERAQPSYSQVADKLTRLIETGEITTGQSLPSERVLAERLQLSRTTVRRAYDELRAKDYISTHGRAGVAVKAQPRLFPQLGRLKGFTEEMRELGKVPSTRLIKREIVSDRTLSSLFSRPATAYFLHLVRIRCGDDLPLSLEVAWYDLTAAPEMADWNVAESAYQFLYDQCGITLSHGDQSIEAIMSSEAETEVFGFDGPCPCLLMKRKTYSATGQMIEYVEGTFRGDIYTYRLELNLSAREP
jgi:GntR family transcriptional regulator